MVAGSRNERTPQHQNHRHFPHRTAVRVACDAVPACVLWIVHFVGASCSGSGVVDRSHVEARERSSQRARTVPWRLPAAAPRMAVEFALGSSVAGGTHTLEEVLGQRVGATTFRSWNGRVTLIHLLAFVGDDKPFATVEAARDALKGELERIVDDLSADYFDVWWSTAAESVETTAGESVPVITLAGPAPELVSLAERLRTAPPSLEEAVAWSRNLAEGLALAHGFPAPHIHGGLRLSNVFVDEEGLPVVSDWGTPSSLLVALDARVHSLGETVAPSPWVGPERRVSGRASTEDDVWAWGLLALCLLLGRDATLECAVDEAGADSPGLRPLVDEAVRRDSVLGSLIADALQTDPARRPTADDLATRLTSHVAEASTERGERSTMGVRSTSPPVAPSRELFRYVWRRIVFWWCGEVRRPPRHARSHPPPFLALFHPFSSPVSSLSLSLSLIWGSDRCVHRSLGADSSITRCLALHPHLPVVATVQDRTRDAHPPIRVWDLNTRSLLRSLGSDARGDRIVSLSFNPTGTMLLAGLTDRKCRVWSLETGECVRHFEGYTGNVLSAAWDPTGRFIAAGSQDAAVRIFGLDADEVVHTLSTPRRRPARAIVFAVVSHPSEDLLAFSAGRTVRVCRWSSGERVFTLRGHRDVVHSLASSSSEFLASASWSGTVRIWSWATGICMRVLFDTHPTPQARASPGSLAWRDSLLALKTSAKLVFWDTSAPDLSEWTQLKSLPSATATPFGSLALLEGGGALGSSGDHGVVVFGV